MRGTIPIRLFSALVVVGSLTAVPLAGPASSAAAPTTCDSPKSVVNLKTLTAVVTLSNCSNKAATGGSGVETVKFKLATSAGITATIKWKGTGTTTLLFKTKAGKTPNKCKAPATMYITTGSVTGGTGTAVTIIKKGSPFSETVCSNATTGASTIYPGTKVVI
jgi:hypothetical protein